jgi:ABC-type dipeptide/oligopeptide/nickel transport system permease subunit
MLYQSQSALSTEPWVAVAPGAFILITAMAVSTIGSRLAERGP